MASFAAKRKARVIKVDEEEISSDNSPSGTDSPDTKKGTCFFFFGLFLSATSARTEPIY